MIICVPAARLRLATYAVTAFVGSEVAVHFYGAVRILETACSNTAEHIRGPPEQVAELLKFHHKLWPRQRAQSFCV